LDEFEDYIVIILCQLEMFFPPSYFDFMVYVLVYMLRKIRLCGPNYLDEYILFSVIWRLWKGMWRINIIWKLPWLRTRLFEGKDLQRRKKIQKKFIYWWIQK